MTQDNGMLNEGHTIDSVKQERWFKEIDQKGELFFVGGSVRDKLLGKESKDVDIVVRGLTLDELKAILSKHGKVDLVGKSFGILKFTPKGDKEAIDIAIPRTERSTGAGHKEFEISADPHLPLIDDLKRRDFTINAIAKDAKGNIVDPFNGREDMKNKVIRAVTPEAFMEDPLRMLRAVQFASRFGFTIAPETLRLIREEANLIKHITGERILIELDKIIKKGDPRIGAKLLRETGLFKAIFGWDGPTVDANDFNLARTIGEFFFLLTKASDGISDDPSDLWRTRFKGDTETAKELQALHTGMFVPKTVGERRYTAMKMLRLSMRVQDSDIPPEPIQAALRDLKSAYPKSLKELDLNGADLMKEGLKGKDVGDALDKALRAIYDDEVDNKKDALLAYLGYGKNVGPYPT